jgi:transposase
MSTTKVAEKFGVSDKAIQKWCDSYEIEKPPRGYWAKVKAGKL